MATPPKNGKLLYHLVSLINFESILSEGLKPRNQVKQFQDIADKDIIIHREKNNLNGLVPFHFFAKTPFAGKVLQNNPEQEFIYITVNREMAKSHGFKILTQHPLSLEYCTLFDYDEGFQKIDWDLMQKRDYLDHDCKMVCMAECLSPVVVSHNFFSTIYVRNKDVEQIVRNICQEVLENKWKFYISVNEDMFKVK